MGNAGGPELHQLTSSRTYGQYSGRCSCGRWSGMGKCGTLAKLRAFHAEHVRDAELRQAAAGGSQPAPVSSHEGTIIRSGATGLIHAECSCGWKSSEYETERTGVVKAIHRLHVVLAEVSRG